MKILAISDEECPTLWEYCDRKKLRQYDLILSSGDLDSEYLSYLVTMGRCPVLYVHGNHDGGYAKNPPLGCDCIDDRLVVYNGLRILGLGGCRWYHPGPHQYREKEMARRIRRLRWALWRSKGVDIVVTHAPLEGIGDGPDNAHRGFACLKQLLDKYSPAYMLHGHVHTRYGVAPERVRSYGQTQVINVCQRYELEVPEAPHKDKHHCQVLYKNPAPKPRD